MTSCAARRAWRIACSTPRGSTASWCCRRMAPMANSSEALTGPSRCPRIGRGAAHAGIRSRILLFDLPPILTADDCARLRAAGGVRLDGHRRGCNATGGLVAARWSCCARCPSSARSSTGPPASPLRTGKGVMYLKHFGLHAKPFAMNPDPTFLYASEQHSAAFTMLEYAIESQASFCLLTGEIGSGKTTLIRHLIRRLADQVTVGLVSNTHQHFKSIHPWALSALRHLPGRRFRDRAIRGTDRFRDSRVREGTAHTADLR